LGFWPQDSRIRAPHGKLRRSLSWLFCVLAKHTSAPHTSDAWGPPVLRASLFPHFQVISSHHGPPSSLSFSRGLPPLPTSIPVAPIFPKSVSFLTLFPPDSSEQSESWPFIVEGQTFLPCYFLFPSVSFPLFLALSQDYAGFSLFDTDSSAATADNLTF